ncbi:MAG: class I SAM-dependent methyltransferase family protein [Candidatus Lokiarchaeota archaeon]|nr:class I SAM-dependent methyltransferase family protein [Candidatus Lokiarchaeota archaeon]MBD3200143.1 class I SAM-dependent methyltransferase family protein [Candidatus Lokiarchaeota archaeon]
MGFKKKLQKELSGELDADELSLIPSGFQTLGDVIVLKLKEELLSKKEIIADKCLEMMPYIRSVYLNRGIVKGKYRKPEQIEFLAGEKNPIVEHKEHGVVYKLDITRIMFSQGNLRERKYLATLVNDGEVIVDMFAGIGYFSLPIASHANPKRIFSIEINSLSYKFLEENIKINDLGDIIKPIHGDCKKEVLKLSKKGLKADRIIMGVFPAPKAYIKESLTLVKPLGTIIHYEGVIDKNNEQVLFEEFSKIAQDEGYSSELKESRFIKSYGPMLYHIVYDILVKKRDN